MKNQIQKLSNLVKATKTMNREVINNRFYWVSSTLKVVVKVVERKQKDLSLADKEKLDAELLTVKELKPDYQVVLVTNSRLPEVPANTIKFFSTHSISNEKIMTHINPFHQKAEKPLLARVIYLSVGVALGINLWSVIETEKITMLTEVSVQQSKLFFLRGCTMYNTLEVCKKQAGFTDAEEIYKNVDAVIENSLAGEAQFDAQSNKELQKLMQGRIPTVKL